MDKKVTFSVRSQLASFPAFVLVLQVLGSFLSPGGKGKAFAFIGSVTSYQRAKQTACFD